MRRTEDLTPSVQADEHLGAGPGAEAMPAAPVPESPGARQPAEDLTAAVDGLGSSERLASMADGSAMVPRAMAEAAGSSGAEAGVADATPEARVEKPTVPEEQTTLPEAPKGMVGHAIQPRSPLVVPTATAGEDKMEEIEHEESRPQAV